MYPVLFTILGYPVRSFGVMLVLGFLVALAVARRRAGRFGVERNAVTDAAFWMLVFGVLGARLGFIVQELPYYLSHPGELWSLRFEGLTSFGGIIGGAAALLVYCRLKGISAMALLDVMSLPFLLAQAVGRVGCTLNGCCYGGPTNGFPGVLFEGVPGLHHPAQLYEAAMVLVGAALLSRFERRERPVGQSLGFALVAYGVARFIYEFWRAGTTSATIGNLPITEGHIAAVLMAVTGAAMMALASRKASLSNSLSNARHRA